MSEQGSKLVRVRFAPSPTGYLHVGGARSALYNYLFAKKNQGAFILRIEDTDLERSTEQSLRMLIEDLQWLGLDWDEGPHPRDLSDRGSFGPYRQSQRLHLYQKYAQLLWEKDLAYYCFMSDEEIEQQRQEKLARGEPPHVDSPYKNWSREQAMEWKNKGKPAALRFRTGHLKKDYVFNDLVRGEVRFPSDMVGDFVLLRSDGMPVYNFCNVIDDHLMEITHVLRAEEHLPNTLRQLMLYEAFGWETPQFGHLSLILDEDRKKLSKRKGATSCHEFKLEGYLPEALINFLALLGWSHPEGKEIISQAELIQVFDLDRLNPAGAVFDPVKLKWMNAQYLRAMPLEQLGSLFLSYLKELMESPQKDRICGEVLPAQELPSYLAMLQNLSQSHLLGLIDVVRSSCETLFDLAVQLFTFYDPAFSVSVEAQEVFSWESTRVLLTRWKQFLEEQRTSVISADTFSAFQEIIKKDLNIKGKYLFMPLRVAVLGRPHGLELKNIIPLMSREQLLSRAQRVLQNVL